MFEDQEFKKAMKIAEEHWVEELRKAAFMRAQAKSDVLLMFLLKAMKPEEFDVIALKSRVHFRRGFDDSGFAPTILLVEPEDAFLGTARLEALDYQHLDPRSFYPYGEPENPLG